MSAYKCPKCGKEIVSNIIECPNCNSSDKSSLKIISFILIFIVIVVILIISSSDNNSSYTSSGMAITSDGIKYYNDNDFTIIENKTKGFRSKDGTYTVKGQLKQNIEGSYTSLMISLNLLDKNNNKVRETTGWIYTNYLGNNIWEFEVNGNDADGVVNSYEINYCWGH